MKRVGKKKYFKSSPNFLWTFRIPDPHKQTKQSNLHTNIFLFIPVAAESEYVDQSKQYLIIFDNKTKARKVNIRLMSIFDIPSSIPSLYICILNVCVKQCARLFLCVCCRSFEFAMQTAKSYRGYKINSYVVHVIEHKYLQ